MSRHRKPPVDLPDWTPYTARGKGVSLHPHAFDGMNAERDPIGVNDVLHVLDDPDHDDGTKAAKWIGRRTVIVYYTEYPDKVLVRGVSATTTRRP